MGAAKSVPAPPPPEPMLSPSNVVVACGAIVLVSIVLRLGALKRKVSTFDGALEVSALSHQLWTANLALQYFVGHMKLLPAAVDPVMLPCAVQHALGAILASKAILHKEKYQARFVFAFINLLYFIGGPVVTEGLHYWGFITLELGYEYGYQYLVPWQFPINYALYIPSILSDIALCFHTSRDRKRLETGFETD